MQEPELTQSEQDAIDRLIPAPWSHGRRRLLVAGLVVVGIATSTLVSGGWLSPSLEFNGSQFGGDSPVTMGFDILNNGSRSVRILSIDATPGANQISASLGDRQLPAVLHPGESATLLGTFEVFDCQSIGRGDDTFGIEVEFADGPFRMGRHLNIDTDGFVFDERTPNEEVHWARAMTQYVCP